MRKKEYLPLPSRRSRTNPRPFPRLRRRQSRKRANRERNEIPPTKHPETKKCPSRKTTPTTSSLLIRPRRHAQRRSDTPIPLTSQRRETSGRGRDPKEEGPATSNPAPRDTEEDVRARWSWSPSCCWPGLCSLAPGEVGGRRGLCCRPYTLLLQG